MNTKKEIEKMEYEAPVAKVYELMTEGCILTGSGEGQLENIGQGGQLGTRSTEFSVMSSERGF